MLFAERYLSFLGTLQLFFERKPVWDCSMGRLACSRSLAATLRRLHPILVWFEQIELEWQPP